MSTIKWVSLTLTQFLQWISNVVHVLASKVISTVQCRVCIVTVSESRIRCSARNSRLAIVGAFVEVVYAETGMV